MGKHVLITVRDTQPDLFKRKKGLSFSFFFDSEDNPNRVYCGELKEVISERKFFDFLEKHFSDN